MKTYIGSNGESDFVAPSVKPLELDDEHCGRAENARPTHRGHFPVASESSKIKKDERLQKLGVGFEVLLDKIDSISKLYLWVNYSFTYIRTSKIRLEISFMKIQNLVERSVFSRLTSQSYPRIVCNIIKN